MHCTALAEHFSGMVRQTGIAARLDSVRLPGASASQEAQGGGGQRSQGAGTLREPLRQRQVPGQDRQFQSGRHRPGTLRDLEAAPGLASAASGPGRPGHRRHHVLGEISRVEQTIHEAPQTSPLAGSRQYRSRDHCHRTRRAGFGHRCEALKKGIDKTECHLDSTLDQCRAGARQRSLRMPWQRQGRPCRAPMIAELMAPAGQPQRPRRIAPGVQRFEPLETRRHRPRAEQRLCLQERHAGTLDGLARALQRGREVSLDERDPSAAAIGRRPGQIALCGDHGRARADRRRGPRVEKDIDGVVLGGTGALSGRQRPIDVHPAARPGSDPTAFAPEISLRTATPPRGAGRR